MTPPPRPSAGSPRRACSSSTARLTAAWHCSTRQGSRRPRAASTRYRRGSSIASWSAHCKGWPSTTWPSSGPRRWNAGRTPTPSAASAAGAGCIAPRSCDCGDTATRPRPRRSRPATSCGPTFAASSAGRSANSAASGCTAATSPAPNRPSWPPTRQAGIPNRDSHACSSLRATVADAAASISDAFDHPSWVPSKERPPSTDLRRAPLLDAQVEIAIAAGNLDAARAACRRARHHRLPVPQQGAGRLRGPQPARLQLADGNASDAQRSFAEAVRLWNEVGAPYETAVARLGLADAYRALGADHRANLEEHAARVTLDRITTGVDPDARRRSLWRQPPRTQPAHPTGSTGKATTGR